MNSPIPVLTIELEYIGQDGKRYTRSETVKELLDADLLHERITAYLRQRKGRLTYFTSKEMTRSPHLIPKTLEEAFPIDHDEKLFQCVIGPEDTETCWIVRDAMTMEQIRSRVSICKEDTGRKLVLRIGNKVIKEDGTHSQIIGLAEEAEFQSLAVSKNVRLEFVSST